MWSLAGAYAQSRGCSLVVMCLLFGDGVVDRDRGVDLGGDVVDEVGGVAPLLDGVDRALVEDL